MLDRDLKNFNKYLGSLEKYAKAAKIKVKYREGDFGGGEYNHQSRVLSIDPNESQKTQIACFLHELGHAFDEVLSDPILQKALGKAYVKFYRKGCTGYQLDLVLACERRAWEYGKALSKLLRIPLGRWYDQCSSEALRTYKEK